MRFFKEIDLGRYWVEYFSFALAFAGFLGAVIIQNDVSVYLTIFLIGFLFGRIFYVNRVEHPILPYIMMVTFFFFGFVLGSLLSGRIIAILLFLGSFSLSYYLHMKQIVGIFKSETFLK